MYVSICRGESDSDLAADANVDSQRDEIMRGIPYEYPSGREAEQAALRFPFISASQRVVASVREEW